MRTRFAVGDRVHHRAVGRERIVFGVSLSAVDGEHLLCGDGPEWLPAAAFDLVGEATVNPTRPG